MLPSLMHSSKRCYAITRWRSGESGNLLSYAILAGIALQFGAPLDVLC